VDLYEASDDAERAKLTAAGYQRVDAGGRELWRDPRTGEELGRADALARVRREGETSDGQVD
jgi:hypothetical protein